MNVEIRHSSFIHLYCAMRWEMCFESLYRFRFVRLYCIIGNAKSSTKNFPFTKPFAAPNRLIDESSRQEAFFAKPVCAVRTLSERRTRL